MNAFDHAQIDSLKAGRVTYRIGHGKSMEPMIMDGHRQTLVPVLSSEDAEKLGCKHWRGQTVTEGELWYITPDDIEIGDALFCKPTYLYTHEVHKIAGKPGDREFMIGRHDRKRMNGWTKKVYGKCIHSEKA